MEQVLTDAQAWMAYPSLRKYFNKLEVALMQGVDAWPAGLPAPEDGDYVVRPVYNLDGMSRGAYRVHLREGEVLECEPGMFIQPYRKGPVQSVDFRVDVNGETCSTCFASGFRAPDGITFSRWEFNENVNKGIRCNNLISPVELAEAEVTHMCVEYINGLAIDIHFRPNPDFRPGVKCLFVVPKANSYLKDMDRCEWTYREDEDGPRAGFIEGRVVPNE